jgi:hypothetical protein
LTGDAVDGDYIQLLQVDVVPSRLTCVYSLFCLLSFFLILDFLLWGYFRYYKSWEPKRKMVFLILALTAIFMGLTLYQSGLVSGTDLRFHLQRLEGVYKGLLAGQFPVRIQPDWLDGYGYASSIFYGDIFLYFPALLRMVGFTLQDAYKIYAETVNIAVVCIAFYSFKKISKDDVAAMAGTVLYAGSTNRLHWMYGQWVGAYSGMMFYPLIVAGFYLIFTEDETSEEYKRLWVPLTLGFTGVLSTHMLSCLMVGVYAVLACLLCIRKVFRKHTFFLLLKAAGVAVLLNLWYLVPFLQYMKTEKLRINSSLTKAITVTDYYARLADYTQDGKNFYEMFLNRSCLGYAAIFLLLLYIVTIPFQKKDKLTSYSRVVFGFTIFAIWVCMDCFPTVKLAKLSTLILKYFLTLQYQSRLLSVIAVLVACVGALFFAMKIFEPKLIYLLAGLLCCITLVQDFQYFETLQPELFYQDGIEISFRTDDQTAHYAVGNGEYLPVATEVQELTKEVQGSDGLEYNVGERKYLTFDVEVNNPTGQEQELLLPLLYYTGYRGYDSQSKEKMTVMSGDNGRVAVTIPSGYQGTLHVAFYEPWYWRAAEIISLLTLCYIIYDTFFRKECGKKWKSRKSQTLPSENTAESCRESTSQI